MIQADKWVIFENSLFLFGNDANMCDNAKKLLNFLAHIRQSKIIGNLATEYEAQRKP